MVGRPGETPVSMDTFELPERRLSGQRTPTDNVVVLPMQNGFHRTFLGVVEPPPLHISPGEPVPVARIALRQVPANNDLGEGLTSESFSPIRFEDFHTLITGNQVAVAYSTPEGPQLLKFILRTTPDANGQAHCIDYNENTFEAIIKNGKITFNGGPNHIGCSINSLWAK